MEAPKNRQGSLLLEENHPIKFQFQALYSYMNTKPGPSPYGVSVSLESGALTTRMSPHMSTLEPKLWIS
jgi:hypothetical protein